MAALHREQPCSNHQDTRIQELCHPVLTHRRQPRNVRPSEEGTEAVCSQGAKLPEAAEQGHKARGPDMGDSSWGLTLGGVLVVPARGVGVDAQELVAEGNRP